MANPEAGINPQRHTPQAGWMAHMVFAYEGSAPTEEALNDIRNFIRMAGSEAIEPTVAFSTDRGKTEAVIDMGVEVVEAEAGDIESVLACGLDAADLALQKGLGLKDDDIRLVEGVPAPVELVKHNQAIQPRPKARIPGFFNGQFFRHNIAEALLEEVRLERKIKQEVEQLKQAFSL